jgi:hypothetical protein
MKFMPVTGENVHQQLLEDSTPRELERNIELAFPNTDRRQHATNEVKIISMKYHQLPDNTLKVVTQCRSNGHTYIPVVQFTDVTFEPAAAASNVKVTLEAGREAYVTPIMMGTNNVRVRCGCLDFYHRFAHYNLGDNSLYGGPFPPYQRKTTTRPPANPSRLPGMCRHLLRVFETLQQARMVR